MKLEGGCFCGGVRYVAEGDPVLKAQCHCRQCQYLSGGGPNVCIAMPKAGFSYTKGRAKRFARSGVAMPVAREFCPECGTHLTGFVEALADVVFLKVGTFDDPALYGGPDMAIFLKDKQSFHHVPSGIPAYERMPE